MFIGEMGCWLVLGLFKAWERFASRRPAPVLYQAVDTTDPDDASIHSQTALNGSAATPDKSQSILRGWRVCLLALPAICDILGTTLMNAGLLLVAASIYQMTRGALVLFVALFSVVFLRRRLALYHWVSLVGVVTGVAIVGLAGALYPDPKVKVGAVDVGADALRAIIGVLMIAGAQIFTASQFVLEEFLMERSNIAPLEVVGWEGIFGFTVTVLGMIVLHFAIGQTAAGRNGIFDMVEGWRQMVSDRRILITSFLIMLSIG
jgi:drug/metabolite transporter (DMT)-like permease